MKVITVTAFTPTFENKGGISALIYHLIKYRPLDVNLQLYTFNINNISQSEIEKLSDSLNIKIIVLRKPILYRIVTNYKIFEYLQKLFDKYPRECYLVPNSKVIDAIKSYNPDFIWLYPYFSFKLSNKLSGYNYVISGVDCISQVCERRASDAYYANNFKRDLNNLFIKKQCVSAEKEWEGSNILMHYVGLDDMYSYKRAYHRENAFFLLHPHYQLKDKFIKFSEEKIKVLIAGKNDHYVYTDSFFMIEGFLKNSDVAQYIEITFLGKGWKNVSHKLKSVGYICHEIEWVENYIEEIIKYDVQVSPISIGSGTKGKVLDAIGNGLLVIGSKYALENIVVKNMESCVLYKHPEDIAIILSDIYQNKLRYEQIASKGRERVRKFHSPERISQRFFEISKNKLSE